MRTEGTNPGERSSIWLRRATLTYLVACGGAGAGHLIATLVGAQWTAALSGLLLTLIAMGLGLIARVLTEWLPTPGKPPAAHHRESTAHEAAEASAIRSADTARTAQDGGRGSNGREASWRIETAEELPGVKFIPYGARLRTHAAAETAPPDTAEDLDSGWTLVPTKANARALESLVAATVASSRDARADFDRALQATDLPAARRAWEALTSQPEAGGEPAARLQLDELARQAADSLRIRFAEQIRAADYAGAIATGERIADLFPRSAMAADFHLLRPRLERLAGERSGRA